MDYAYYDNRIRLLQDCIKVLRRGCNGNNIIDKHEVDIQSTTIDVVITELQNRNYAKEENGNIRMLNSYDNNIYIYEINKEIDRIRLDKEREKLSEKGINSSERSAAAAERSAKEAMKANCHFWITTVIAIISLIVSLFTCSQKV